MKQRFLTILLSFCLLSPLAHGQDRGEVVSFAPVTPILSVQQAQALINSLSPLDLPDFVLNLLTDIDFPIQGFKVVYGTVDFDGNATVASGLVVAPQAPCPIDMMVYCHGTVFDKAQVPSNLSGAGDGAELLFGLLYGGNGYLTVMPDYLGMGDSPNFHLYLDERTQASATVDLMIAARNLAMANGIPLTQKAHLSGYSQGGHAGMSAFRYLQEVDGLGFQVRTAGLGSGPYSLGDVQYNYILNDPGYARPEFVLYTIASCQEAFGNIYTTPDEVLVAPYDQLYTTHILGQTGDVSWVANPYTDMLTPDFYQDIRTNPNNAMRQCLEESDVFDWDDRLPTAMYFCTADLEVNYRNTIVAEHRFERRLPWHLFWMRALINSVYLGPLSHGDCVIPYTLVSKLRFDHWQTDCEATFPEGRQPLASEGPAAIRSINHYYVDVRVSTVEGPLQRVEFLRFDGSLAATFSGLKAKDGAIRLDVREMEPGAYVLRFLDAKGTETLSLIVLEPVQILKQEDYNPLAYSPDKEEYELDLSLLPEPVQSLLIYDEEQQLVRELDANEALERVAFTAKGLAPGAHTLEVRTAQNSYFLELTEEPWAAATGLLSVFPNPATDYLTIRLSGSEQMASATLFDSQGRQVWRRQNVQGMELRPGLQLSAGIYQLKVVTASGKVLVEKVVIH